MSDYDITSASMDALQETGRFVIVRTQDPTSPWLRVPGDGAFDPDEQCRACGYRLGDHRLGDDCPTEIDLARRYGYM